MDTHFQLQGLSFIWNAKKAKLNVINHDGISFEQAAEAFFDPFMRLVDASRQDEARDALIGFDARGSLLFIVHIVIEDEAIRIISARPATLKERQYYDQ
jgi:uncharacterized protein